MNLSADESFELFQKVKDNKNYDSHRFLAKQISDMDKVYEDIYNGVKEDLESGVLPLEDAYVLFYLGGKLKSTLSNLTKIENLIKPKLKR